MTTVTERPGLLHQPLTRAEARVLAYLPTYMTYPEIAAELYISRNTVKFHLREIYTRLGVHNRVEAARAAQDGLTTSPAPRGTAPRARPY